MHKIKLPKMRTIQIFSETTVSKEDLHRVFVLIFRPILFRSIERAHRGKSRL